MNQGGNRGPAPPGSALRLRGASGLSRCDYTAHAQPVSLQNLQWGSCRRSWSILLHWWPCWCFRYLRCSHREARRERKVVAVRLGISPLCLLRVPSTLTSQREGLALPQRTPGAGSGLQLPRGAWAEAGGIVGLGGARSLGRRPPGQV